MTKAISVKSKSKLTKKELKQDRLVEFTVKAESFYQENKRIVIGVLTGIVVVVIAVVVIVKSQKSAQLEESYQLTMAKMKYGANQLDDAQQGFQQIVSQLSGKPAAEAQYFLARIAFDKGDYAGAEAGFNLYLKDYSADDALNAAALSGLAASLEAEGKPDQALDSYEKVAKEYPNLAYAPQCLLQVSRLALKLNHPDRARQALKTIVDSYQESSEYQQARKDLDNLE